MLHMYEIAHMFSPYHIQRKKKLDQELILWHEVLLVS